MNLRPSFGEAHSLALMNFFKAKNNSCLYIIRWNISRKNPLYAVFSQKEAEKYRISIKEAHCVGDSVSTIKAKENYLKLKNDPRVQKHDALVKYLRSSKRASELERECENY